MLKDLTVLSRQTDPYRFGTAEHWSIARWIVDQVDLRARTGRRIHIRGLHYALVQAGNARKPYGEIYMNNDEDYGWLHDCVKAARWLKLLPFDRIEDKRNAEPVRVRSRLLPPDFPRVTHGGSLSIEATGGLWVHEIVAGLKREIREPFLDFDEREQPFAIVIFGEKSSLDDVLAPLARSCNADLYLGQGETSDTLVYEMAKDAIADGRPLVVVTVTDFDPSGRQMSVSISRKLQALKDLHFPTLEFSVVQAALTVDQVREFQLPSTPLKRGEKRAARWRSEFGDHEQTEIDAMLTPEMIEGGTLRRIVQAALAPYYDWGISSRTSTAEWRWSIAARRIFREQIDNEAVDTILQEADAVDAEIKREVEEQTEALRTIVVEIQTKAEEKATDLNDRLQAAISDLEIELPELPVQPEIELAEKPPGSVLIDSAWDWIEQTRSLKARKNYGADDDADGDAS